MPAAAPRVGSPTLDRIRSAFGLSEQELAGIFGVSRPALGKWRARGVPYERAADVDRVAELAEDFVARYIAERVPQIVRTPDKALRGRTILAALTAGDVDAVRANLERELVSYAFPPAATKSAGDKDALAALQLDGSRKTLFFSQSTTTADIAKSLREPMTERELVERAIAIAKTDPANFIRLAVLAHSRRVVIEDSARRRKTAEVYNGTRMDTQRVSGAADAALAQAYAELLQEGVPITASRLRTRAHRDFRAAERWLIANHPEHVTAAGAQP